MSATNPAGAWRFPQQYRVRGIRVHNHRRLERTGARSRVFEHITVHNDAPDAPSASGAAQERCGDT